MLSIQSQLAAPLIDIDYTVFVQLGIFLVMALAATKFLFKPYLKLREQRHAGIEGSREDAQKMEQLAVARNKEYEEKLAAARESANDERRKIRTETSEHTKEVVEKARKNAAEKLSAAKASVEKEVATARGEIMPKADEIATAMIEKLLGRKV